MKKSDIPIAFTNATKKLFSECDVHIEELVSYNKAKEEQDLWQIVSYIGLNIDDGIGGGVSININREAANMLAMKFGSEGVDDDSVMDAMGELINIIIGNSKRELQDQKGSARDIKISCPNTNMSQTGIKSSFPKSVKNLVGIPFEIGEKRFPMEIIVGIEDPK